MYGMGIGCDEGVLGPGWFGLNGGGVGYHISHHNWLVIKERVR